jgi:AcrR family transcriptional regulator
MDRTTDQTTAEGDLPTPSWALRAAEQSPSVQRSRVRSVQRAHQIVQAARRLVATKGSSFTTQDLVKEAGIAVQTFYKHFAGKDQVILAVIEDLVLDTCTDLQQRARELPDPVARLRFYITSVVRSVGVHTHGDPGPRFITTEHWRLHRLHPEELAHATRPFTDLLLPEIHAAMQAGLLDPPDPQYDAWLVNQLVIAVFHHYEYATFDESPEQIADRLWRFCFAALGGSAAGASRPTQKAAKKPRAIRAAK